jgi:hypothetical protein
MKSETECFNKFIVSENDNGKIIESKIKPHDININVSIILSKKIIANYDMNQCKNVINNSFKIFEEETLGRLPMERIIKQVDFSNILMDDINGKITLIVQYSKESLEVVFNSEYEIEIIK